MADQEQHSGEDAEKKEGGGVGGFMQDNAGLLMLGLLAILAFMFAGPLVGLIALIGGGLFAFGSGMLGKAADSLGVGETLGLSKPHEPQKKLPLGVKLDADDPQKATVDIDGRTYDIEMELNGTKTKKFTYQTEGGAKKTYMLNAEESVADFDKEGKVIINKERFTKYVAGPVDEEVRKEAKEAVDKYKLDGRVVSKDQKTILVPSDILMEAMTPEDKAKMQAGGVSDTKLYFVATVGENGFDLKNLNGDILATRTGLSPESLKPGGPLMREIGVAVASLGEDTLKAKGSLGLDIDGNIAGVASEPVATIIKPITSPQAENIEFKLNGAKASYSVDQKDYTVDKDGIVKLNSVTIELNERKHTHTLKPPREIGQFTSVNSKSSYTPKDGFAAMEEALQDAAKSDAKAIEGYAKNVNVIADATGLNKILYQTKDAAYIIKTNPASGSFVITDLEGNTVKNKKGEDAEKTIDTKNNIDALKNEALHMLKEMGVSSEPPPAGAGLKKLANREEQQGIDMSIPQGGLKPNAPNLGLEGMKTQIS